MKKIKLASKGLRFLSLLYESFLFVAISIVSSGILTFVLSLSYSFFSEEYTLSSNMQGYWRFTFQVTLLILWGSYYCFLWKKKGQTLAMKVWGIRVINSPNEESYECLSYQLAMKRYLLCVFFFPFNFLWCFVDPEGHFLHDRLCGTKIIQERSKKRSEEELKSDSE